MRFDPRKQDARFDRFVNVVVRAEFEAEHFIELIVPRGHHDDHAIEMSACLAAYLEAVLAGQVDIEDHQIRLTLEYCGNCLVAMPDGIDLIVVLAEISRDQRRKAFIVFDEQDPEGHEGLSGDAMAPNDKQDSGCAARHEHARTKLDKTPRNSTCRPRRMDSIRSIAIQKGRARCPCSLNGLARARNRSPDGSPVSRTHVQR